MTPTPQGRLDYAAGILISTTFLDGSTTSTDYHSIGQIETSTDPLL